MHFDCKRNHFSLDYLQEQQQTMNYFSIDLNQNNILGFKKISVSKKRSKCVLVEHSTSIKYRLNLLWTKKNHRHTAYFS